MKKALELWQKKHGLSDASNSQGKLRKKRGLGVQDVLYLRECDLSSFNGAHVPICGAQSDIVGRPGWRI
jgi:hypothetical protein